MNILFMGTPDIAAAALEAILDAGHTVCGVYTRADKPVGRKQVLTAPQKAQACAYISAASLVATGDLDRDFAAAYTAAKV